MLRCAVSCRVPTTDRRFLVAGAAFLAYRRGGRDGGAWAYHAGHFKVDAWAVDLRRVDEGVRLAWLAVSDGRSASPVPARVRSDRCVGLVEIDANRHQIGAERPDHQAVEPGEFLEPFARVVVGQRHRSAGVPMAA